MTQNREVGMGLASKEVVLGSVMSDDMIKSLLGNALISGD